MQGIQEFQGCMATMKEGYQKIEVGHLQYSCGPVMWHFCTHDGRTDEEGGLGAQDLQGGPLGSYVSWPGLVNARWIQFAQKSKLKLNW